MSIRLDTLRHILAPGAGPSVFGDAKITTALLDRLTHPSRDYRDRNESWRFNNRT